MEVPKPIKLTKEQRAAQRLERRLEKARLAVQKAKQPKISELKKKVQKEVNAYVRLRDAGQVCISCQKPPKSVDAGHYINQGSSGYLRYDLNNIHGQCDSCNRFKSGNKIEYRINLVKKIGKEEVEYLEEHMHDVHKWTREELENIRTNIKALKGLRV